MGHWNKEDKLLTRKIEEKREEKNIEKKNELHVPLDFHQRNKVFLFFSEKNECPPCETVTATSTQFLNKEGTRAYQEMEFCSRRKQYGLQLSEKEEVIYQHGSWVDVLSSWNTFQRRWRTGQYQSNQWPQPTSDDSLRNKLKQSDTQRNL